MIYNHIVQGEFYRLEEDCTIHVSWFKLSAKTAGLLGLQPMSYNSSFYEGNLTLPKGTIFQYYKTGFRVLKTYRGQVIKHIFMCGFTTIFNLKYLSGKEITHLSNPSDIFESRP